MKLFSHTVVFFGAVSLVGAGLTSFASWWLLDRSSPLSDSQRLVYELRRSQALDERNQRAAYSGEIKREIVDELLAGRLNLHEAIERFQEANGMIGSGADGMVTPYLTPIDPPGIGRQVICWAQSRLLEKSSGESVRAVTCLEEEYQRLYGPSNNAVVKSERRKWIGARWSGGHRWAASGKHRWGKKRHT